MGIYETIEERRNSIKERKKERSAIKKRNKEIIELRKKGETLESIGLRYNLTRERIRQIILAHNKQASITDQVPSFSAEQRKRHEKKEKILEKKELIKALLDEGKTLAEVALKLGITRTLLYQAEPLLREFGILFPKNKNESKINLDVASRMRSAGATYRTIANKFGVSAPSVYSYLLKHK